MRLCDGVVCYCCGSIDGHTADKCDKRKEIPTSKWYINAGKSFVNAQTSNESTDQSRSQDASARSSSSRRSESNNNTTSSRRSRSGGAFMMDQEDDPSWNGIMLFQADHRMESKSEIALNTKHGDGPWSHLRNVILMDSAATCNSYNNPELCTNVRMAKRPVQLATNTGTKRIDLEAELLPIGYGQCDPESIANICSMSRMIKDGWRLTMDTAIEKCINLWCDDDTKVKFQMTEEGLFAHEPSKACHQNSHFSLCELIGACRSVGE